MKDNVIEQYDNEGKYYRRRKLFAKRYNKEDDNKYETNIGGVRTLFHVGYGWRIFRTEQGLIRFEFYIQLIFFYFGPTVGLNDDLFDE